MNNWRGYGLILALASMLCACGRAGDAQGNGHGVAVPAGAEAGQGIDPDGLARAAVAAQNVPDPDGKTALALAEAVRALPAWAPFYPGARLSLDSGAQSIHSVQVGFTTPDSDDKVAAFYMNSMRAKGDPTDLPEDGVRSIEVANGDQTEITSVILMPLEAGGTSGIIRYERTT